MRAAARRAGWQALALGVSVLLSAPVVAGEPTVAAPADARAWLARIHGAASSRNYQGTMVFTASGTMISSRVAHFQVDGQVYERIEALDGRPRQVFRHNDVVHTVWPDAGLAVVERRGPVTGLPSSTQSVEPRALEQYELRPEGRDRVAGREAQVFTLWPRDEWRFAQRLWADQETGLMLRADVLAPSRAVLESSAFSAVEIGVRSQPDSVLLPMKRVESLRVLRPVQVPAQLEQEGWAMVRPLPAGFRLAQCVRRAPMAPQSAGADSAGSEAVVIQAVFSDGLTHVSLFIEPYQPARHRKDIQAQFGATHSLAGRRGDHWITAMGDVPGATLRHFVDALERRP